MLTDAFREIALREGLERVVFEITEHQPIDDYGAHAELTAELRRHGARIAVDDAGAGYASLQHILHLAPDYIKLDIEFTRDVDSDLTKQAIASALVRFGSAIGASIIAEGIETADELACLAEIGIGFGQGYHIARPTPLDDSALRWAASHSSHGSS
jgi:EAL domain-containing protein (putative c-di-GMP-specific phosphodiesterase class I)